MDLNEKSGGKNERCQKFWLFPSMQCSRDANIVTHFPVSIYTVTELFSGLQFYSVSSQKRTNGIQNIVYKSSITMPSGCEAKLQFSKECTESEVLSLSLRDTAP